VGSALSTSRGVPSIRTVVPPAASLVSRLKVGPLRRREPLPTCRRECANPASGTALELGLCIEHLAAYLAEHGELLAEKEAQRAKYAGYHKTKSDTTNRAEEDLPEEDVQ
jgi:hypothetical protein